MGLPNRASTFHRGSELTEYLVKYPTQCSTYSILDKWALLLCLITSSSGQFNHSWGRGGEEVHSALGQVCLSWLSSLYGAETWLLWLLPFLCIKNNLPLFPYDSSFKELKTTIVSLFFIPYTFSCLTRSSTEQIHLWIPRRKTCYWQTTQFSISSKKTYCIAGSFHSYILVMKMNPISSTFSSTSEMNLAPWVKL